MFATRTKNEQSASSNAVNFIDPIPAYAGMTKNAYDRRDKKKKNLSLLRRQEWVHTVFATRTKNEQSASSNAVNFIDPIPAYDRRDKTYPRRWVSIALQEKKEKLSATHWISAFAGMTEKVGVGKKNKKLNNLTIDVHA